MVAGMPEKAGSPLVRIDLRAFFRRNSARFANGDIHSSLPLGVGQNLTVVLS